MISISPHSTYQNILRILKGSAFMTKKENMRNHLKRILTNKMSLFSSKKYKLSEHSFGKLKIINVYKGSKA